MAMSTSERYQTLKRIRWPSTQPLIYNNEINEWVISTNADQLDSSNNERDLEIVGNTEHIEKLRKIFAESSATRVSVIEEFSSPPLPPPSKLNKSSDTTNKLNKSSDTTVTAAVPVPATNGKAASPRTGLRSASLGNPSVHKLDGKANRKSPLFQSLSNLYGPTEDGHSSDSDEEIVIQHRRNHSESAACGLSPEVQNRRDIIRVQNRIINLGDKSLITPTRLYIKEGEFTKVGSKSKTIFFLFDDLLLIGKLVPATPSSIQGTTRVKFRKALDLRCVDVQAVPDNKAKYLLVLKYYSSKNLNLTKWRRTYSAPTKMQRDEWFADLCSLREKLNKGSSKAAIAAVRTLSSPRLLMY